jgi:1-acyl-sn-glycerol-3-phosphate acyltransferase
MFRYPVYWIARSVARGAASVYFGRTIVRGSENIPAEGPAIIAANHPQSILDALLISISCRRTVHYLAHGGLFRNRIKRAMLRACGAIPIHRHEDAQAEEGGNLDSFAACRALLEAGGCLGIFPEGTSLEKRRVQPLKTGTARIAFDAEVTREFGLGVRIVPAGLSFQSRRRFRSNVLASFGRPIEANAYAELYAEDPAAAVRQLTEKLGKDIRGLVVDVDRSELEELVTGVERIYKGEILHDALRNFRGKDRFDREHFVSREIAAAAQYFYEHDPEGLTRVKALMEIYGTKLERLKLKDQIVRDADQSFRDMATRLVALVALASPIALYGALWNALPYQLTRLLVRRLSPDGTKTHFYQLTQGAWIFLIFYAFYFYGLDTRFGPWNSLALLSTFALSGLFCLRFVAALSTGRSHLRLVYLRATHGVTIQKLVILRRNILREMEIARRIYERAQSSGEIARRPTE